MNARLVTFGIYLAALVAMADQGSKWWLVTSVMQPPHVEFVTPYLNFVLSFNKGITFGILNQASSFMPAVFVGVTVVILVLLLSWLVHAKNTLVGVGIGLVMGGAVGNVLDRVNYGAVVDFLDFHAFGYHWYAFNIADSAIVMGVCLLLLDNLITDFKKKE